MSDQNREITITRTILVPPARVYAAFTTADGWCAWCCEKAEADASIGGKLHIYTEGYNAYGEYRVLEPDRTVTFTWDGDGEPPTLIQVLLERLEAGTQLTFKVKGLGSTQDWDHFTGTIEGIWGRVLNNLKNVLETEQ